MKLKNKYSKQNIYSNQKFKDQIWYNQQIMTFLNFSQLSESVFRINFSGKHFSENQVRFFFDWKVFFVDQLFKRQTNTGKFGKWFFKNHFLENKHNQKRKYFPKNQAKFFFVFRWSKNVFYLSIFLITKKY